ncbi:hypothetical protein OG394_00760 [Kribbella sp. NBC_01245]|uniref:hypothetical protein n=1 Tax=Kribbella sp. NBC_01245 TaxID=2903578 RepID=UPI002E2BFA47|nr:hypothetical protein [Kribbella sp. NBC_01245]
MRSFHDSTALLEQLNTAPRHGQIGRAQGILMRHCRLGTEIVLVFLKRGRQTANVKLSDLAKILVEAHERDMLSDTLAAWNGGGESVALSRRTGHKSMTRSLPPPRKGLA